MNERELRHSAPLEDEGIPDLEGPLESKEMTGDGQDGIIAPRDFPLAVNDFGTTAAEEIAGESLDGRLRREVPDPTMAFDTSPEGYLSEREYRPAGRIVQPDEGSHPDTEKDAVGFDVGGDHGGFSAEEEAMHIVDAP